MPQFALQVWVRCRKERPISSPQRFVVLNLMSITHLFYLEDTIPINLKHQALYEKDAYKMHKF